MIKIQSFSDIITNSSSETFLVHGINNNPDFDKWITEGKVKCDWIFHDMDEVKKYILEKSPWNPDEYEHASYDGEIRTYSGVIEFDPFNSNEFIKALKETGKTEEEIWEFFKDLYKDFVNTASITRSDGGDGYWNNDAVDWYYNAVKTGKINKLDIEVISDR
jgi:hypothetical protein